MSPKYHLVTDNGTQWFHYLIFEENNQIKEGYAVPNNLIGPYLSNIYQRPLHFQNIRFGKIANAENFDTGASWYGWSLSSKEFDRIKLLIKLRKTVDEYEKLIRYE